MSVQRNSGEWLGDWLGDGFAVDRGTDYPVYMQVRDRLLTAMQLFPGDFQLFPKDEQLVQILGVSRDSVQRAMAQLVESGHVVRIKRKGTLPNWDALAHRLHGVQGVPHEKVVGVLMPHSNDWFRSLASMEKAALDRGYKVDIRAYNWLRTEDHNQLLEALVHTTHGVLLYPCWDPQVAPFINEIAAHGTPLQLFDIRHEGIMLPLVSADNRGGAEVMVAHMIRNGYRRIAFAARDSRISTIQCRLEGWRQAHVRAGLQAEKVLQFNLLRDDLTERSLPDFLREVRPDAVFCADHFLVHICMQYARDHGLKLPDDLGLAAFDRQPQDDFMNPPLSVIEQRAHEMGAKAMVALIDRVERRTRYATDIIVPVNVYLRRSTSP